MAGSQKYPENRVLVQYGSLQFSPSRATFNCSTSSCFFEGPPKIRWKGNSSASVPRSVLLPLQRHLGSKACTPKHDRPGCSVTERCNWLCPSQAKIHLICSIDWKKRLDKMESNPLHKRWWNGRWVSPETGLSGKGYVWFCSSVHTNYLACPDDSASQACRNLGITWNNHWSGPPTTTTRIYWAY